MLGGKLRFPAEQAGQPFFFIDIIINTLMDLCTAVEPGQHREAMIGAILVPPRAMDTWVICRILTPPPEPQGMTLIVQSYVSIN